MTGSLACKEVGRDALGRRVTIQRWKGSGPVRAGDSFVVLVQVPDSVTRAGRIFVRNEVAGEVNVVTPARGRTRGIFQLKLMIPGASLGTVDLGMTEGKRDDLAIQVADRWADQ